MSVYVHTHTHTHVYEDVLSTFPTFEASNQFLQLSVRVKACMCTYAHTRAHDHERCILTYLHIDAPIEIHICRISKRMLDVHFFLMKLSRITNGSMPPDLVPHTGKSMHYTRIHTHTHTLIICTSTYTRRRILYIHFSALLRRTNQSRHCVKQPCGVLANMESILHTPARYGICVLESAFLCACIYCMCVCVCG
jgi:hypothetical protein